MGGQGARVEGASLGGATESQNIKPFWDQYASLNEQAQNQADSIRRRSPAGVASFNALRADPSAQTTAAQAANVRAPGSAQVGQAALVRAQGANAARLGPAAQSQFGGVQEQGPVAQQQQQLIGMQMDAAQGRGPSIAQNQLGQGISRSIAAQNAMANSARGAQAGTAQRHAALNAADLQAQGAVASGQLRAQEQQAAQQQLGNTLATARGQNIDLAQSNAQLGLQNSQFNAAANNANTLQGAQFQQQAALANQQAAMQAQQANAGAFNANALQNAQFLQQGGQFGAQLQSQQGQFNAQLAQQAALANAGYFNAQNLQSQALSANMENSNAVLRQRAQQADDATLLGLLGYQSGNVSNEANVSGQMLGLQQKANMYNAGAEDSGNAFTWQMIGQGAQAAAAALPLLASDERLKKNVRKPSKEQVEELLAAIKPRTYEYKDAEVPGAAPGRFLSPMAQDLEKSELGKDLVVEGVDGYKRVDYARGLGALLASAAFQEERIAKLEKKGGK
jgi:hypothetical protein